MHQNQTVFENIEWKGEIACNEQFLFFPPRFLLNQIIVSPFVLIFYFTSSFAAESEDPKIGIWCKEVMRNKNQIFFSKEIPSTFHRSILCYIHPKEASIMEKGEKT